MENDERTQRIINDVLASLEQSKHPIVLTERREHAETINAMLLDRDIDSVVLKGAMRASERKAVEEQLPTAQVVVATGKYVGEGFDLPRLDTLFLAMPIAWKGSLAQYAGRIHRESDGKDCTIDMSIARSLCCECSTNGRKAIKPWGTMSFNGEAPEHKQLSTEFLLATNKQGSKLFVA